MSNTNTRKKNDNGNILEVDAKGALELMRMIARANKDLPANRQRVLMLESAPGVGKSSICAQFAKEEGRDFKDIRLAYAAPTDVRGFPIVNKNGKMDFAPPADYPTEPHSLLLLDEITVAPKATQAAALQLVLDKKVGDYEVPADTLIVLAGNRAKDRTGAERMGSALVNRVVRVTLKPDLDTWFDWAIKAKVDPRVIAFIKFRPNFLSEFGADWNGEDAFASPRSWECVSDLLNGGLDMLGKDLRMAALQGSVGPGAGIEFGGFLDCFTRLPDIDAMIKKPQSGTIPTEPSVLLAMVASIASKTNVGNIANVLELTDRIEREFQVLAIKIVMKREPAVMSVPAGSAWISKHAKDLGA